MENINNTYFKGYYKDIWKKIIPAELTLKEVDFIQQYFKLEPGGRVLDLMCGYGRHAVGLGRKGIEVTAVDNLDDYISELNTIVSEEALPVKAVKADVLDFEAEGLYNLAICMGNSLCFFDRNDTITILKMIARHLNPGGHLFVNTWMLAEIVFKDFREKSWSDIRGTKYITESKYYIQPSRIETDHLIITPEGEQETKKAIDYIYSIGDTELIFSEAGFVLDEVYSVPGRRKFTLGDPRAYIIAHKK